MRSAFSLCAAHGALPIIKIIQKKKKTKKKCVSNCRMRRFSPRPGVVTHAACVTRHRRSPCRRMCSLYSRLTNAPVGQSRDRVDRALPSQSFPSLSIPELSTLNSSGNAIKAGRCTQSESLNRIFMTKWKGALHADKGPFFFACSFVCFAVDDEEKRQSENK